MAATVAPSPGQPVYLRDFILLFWFVLTTNKLVLVHIESLVFLFEQGLRPYRPYE